MPQNSITKQTLLQWLSDKSGESVEALADNAPLDIIQKSLAVSVDKFSEQTIKHIAFVVLASFNLAKASEIYAAKAS